MEITPKTLRDVVFRERLRGYDEDDVDEFLERVATGVEILQERFRQAVERAELAEARCGELTGADDTLRRTLTLAQRTADAAVQEAEQQAARTVEEANGHAGQIVERAHEQARLDAVAAQEHLRRDLAQLGAARDKMRTDVSALERYLDGERKRLRLALGDAIRWIEEGIPGLVPAPAQHDVALPPDPGDTDAWSPSSDGAGAPDATDAADLSDTAAEAHTS